MKTLGRKARLATVAAFVVGATSLALAHPVAAAPSRCFGKPARIGGSGTITGTAGNDVIIGSNGDDTIDGLGGNDLICGLEGDDVLQGGPGNDRVDGGPGSDFMNGDVLSFEAVDLNCVGGTDLLLGGPGVDFIAGDCTIETADTDRGPHQRHGRERRHLRG